MGVPKHAQCLAEGVRPERKSVIIVGIYIIELVLSHLITITMINSTVITMINIIVITMVM